VKYLHDISTLVSIEMLRNKDVTGIEHGNIMRKRRIHQHIQPLCLVNVRF